MPPSVEVSKITQSLADWLDEVGFGKYADAFVAEDVDLDVLDQLTESHLKELGISLGDRLRLLKAIGVKTGRENRSKPSALAAPESSALQIEENPETPASQSGAERRPLTVMFCELADSTALSTQLDPEDLQDVIRTYQETCTLHIHAYEGYVAKYMGDGILIYFGYPKALERNAERAVRSALDIVEAMTGLNRSLGKDKGIEIAVRVGIATGIVMVGEIVGEGMAQERTVIGEAPNTAARLQGLARRNGIVIGSLTRELTGDAFAYEDLGSHELKGISGQVQAWGVTGLSHQAGRKTADVHHDAIAVPVLVGRDEEIGLLRRAWQSTKDEGRGQVVTLSGEAGIGKSSLIDGLKAEVRAEGLPLLTMRCSPYHTNSALYPVIQRFKRLAGWQPGDDAAVRLDKLEHMMDGYAQPNAETVPSMAALLSTEVPDDRYPPLMLSPQQQKQHTQDMLVGMTLDFAERGAFLELWEDLHWADPSTLELIGLLVEQAPTTSLLTLTTARPEFVPPWPARSHITPITLNRLERPHAAALVARLVGEKPLPDEVIDHIVTKTDGVPLYVEELTKTILASDILQDVGEHFELTGPLESLAIPDTLQESLMARLDRLPEVREIVQLGSVLGREFAYEMISGLSNSGDGILEDGLGQLVDAELLYQRGRPRRAKYIFKHALVQDAAYASLLRRTRQQYHQQVAELLEAEFPDIVQNQPELIARHYGEAGIDDRAIDYLWKAGERSLLRSANEEAIAHLNMGLEIIGGMTDGAEWERQELDMLLISAPALVAVRGYAAPEVAPAYRRALELCRKLGDVDKEISVLLGQSMFHFLQADILLARQLADQAVDLAKTSMEQGFALVAQRQLGLVSCFQGELDFSVACFDKVATSYDIDIHGELAFRRGGADFGVAALATNGFVLVPLGYSDQARNKCAAAMAIAEEKGFPQYIAWITAIRGGVHLDRGAFPDAIAETKKALALDQAIGSRLFVPNWAINLADAYGRSGEVVKGLGVIADALDHVTRTEERYSEAELYRIRGELRLLGDTADYTTAEASFQKAIEIARAQKAKTWELRAATSLARLWQEQGKADAARDLLRPVYDWFTKGFDTADLKGAKALLDELA